MKLHDWAKQSAKFAAGKLIAAGWLRPLDSADLAERIKIVYAHYFGPPKPYLPAGMAMSLDELHRNIKRLSERFDFVPLDKMIAEGCGDGPRLRNAVAVTLDDGYDILREGAYEIFEEFKVPVTTFVVIDAIDNRNLIWANKLRAIESEKGSAVFRAKLASLQLAHGYGSRGVSTEGMKLADLGWPAERKDALADELWRACDMPELSEYLQEHRPYHTLAQLRDLIRRGHGIGLHTRTHPYCDTLTAAEVEAEFVQPARWLREQLGLTTLPMAYPFGVRLPGDQERRLAEAAIVTCALGLSGFSKRPSDPMTLRRTSLEGNMELSVFAADLKNRMRKLV
jgi:peptidoglycan/xylan/chitin deacetylase (PgdA/CDA1 family)